MSIIFDGVIFLCLLIAFITGLGKGFMKSIWGLVTFAALVVGIYFAAPPLAKIAVEKTTVDQSLTQSIGNLYGKLSSATNTEVSAETLETVLTEMNTGVSSVVVKLFGPTLRKYVPSEGTTTIKAILGERTAYSVILSGVSLVLAIIIGIIVKIIKKILLGIAKISVVKPLDRLLGLAYCVTLTAAVFVAIGGIAYTMKDMKFMAKVNSTYPDSIAFKYIYGENPLQEFFDAKVNLGKYLSKYISTGTPDNTEETPEEEEEVTE